MLLRDFKQGRSLLISLDHGADIMKQISYLLDKEEIESAVFCAIGALINADLAFYNQTSQEYKRIEINEPVEMVSCTGNVSLRDGKPFAHAHAALGCPDGKAIGGHLLGGKVFAAEVFFQELLGEPLVRRPDSVTGLYLWSEL